MSIITKSIEFLLVIIDFYDNLAYEKYYLLIYCATSHFAIDFKLKLIDAKIEHNVNNVDKRNA